MIIKKPVTELTKEQKLDRKFNMMVENNAKNYEILKSWVKNSFESFWTDPELTPQEIATKWGTDALSLFIAHAKAQELIAFIDNTYVPLTAPKQIIPEIVDGNPTGRITISE